MSKFLMVSSSLVLGAAGIVATFAPVELLSALGVQGPASLAILVQLLGALYFAFAITNWTAKDSIIGGIYARPLSLGNFTHFLIGGLALAKLQTQGAVEPWLLAVCVIYILYAVGFARLLMVGPRQARTVKNRKEENQP